MSGQFSALVRWFTTGVGWGAEGLSTSAEDLAAFHALNWRNARRAARALTLLLLGCNLLFWATDDWLLGHIPAVQPALSEGRLVMELLGLGVLAGTFAPHWLLLPLGWITAMAMCGVVGWTMGRIGGPDTAWFHLGYPFIFFTLIAWLTPLHRTLVTLVACATMGLAYFGLNPAHLSDPMAGSAIANLAYFAILAAAVGLYLDHMRLRVFVLVRDRESERDRLAVRVGEQTQHIQALLDHVEAVRERERTEIAADLHDEMGQVLTGMRCVLKVARERGRAGSLRGTTELDQLSLLLQHLSRSLRGVLSRLRPQVLEDLGLGAAAEWLLERTTTSSGLACALELPADSALADVPREDAAIVFRVIQEALTNVVRHAAASHVAVRLSVDAGVLQLCVEDDGVGFEAGPQRVQRAGHGLGLLGMVERTRAAGGELQVQSAPGAGTSIQLRLQIRAAA